MGVVGGLVGLLGGLGGFILPLTFAALKPLLGTQAAFITLLVVTLVSTVIFVGSMLRLRALGRRPNFA